MLHLLLEIQNYSQIERIRPETVSELSNVLEKSFKDTHLIPERYENGFYLLSFAGHIYSNPCVPIETAYKLSTVLNDFGEDLSGYNIFIDETASEQSAEVYSRMKKSLMTVDTDDNILIGDKILSLISPYYSYRKHSVLYKITGVNEKKSVRLDDLESFCRRPDIEDTVWNGILEVSSGRSEYLLITGDPLNLPHITTLQCLENHGIGSDNRLILYEKSGHDPYECLSSCLTQDLLLEAEKFLLPEEKIIWSKVTVPQAASEYPPKGDSYRDMLHEDCEILFKLFLSAFSRRNAGLKLPAVVVVIGRGTDHEASTGMIFEHLKNFITGRGIVLIMIPENAEIPESLAGLKNSVCNIPELSREETVLRIPYIPENDNSIDPVDGIMTVTKGLLLPVFHLGKLIEKSQDKGGCDLNISRPVDIAWRFLELCPTAIYEILFIIRLSDGVLTPQLIDGFYRRSSSRVQFETTVRDLYSIGMIHDLTTMHEYYSELPSRISHRLHASEKDIQDDLNEYIFTLWENDHLKSTVPLINLLLSYGTWNQAFRVFSKMMRNICERNMGPYLENYTQVIRTLRQRSTVSQKAELEILMFSIKLGEAVRNGHEAIPDELNERIRRSDENEISGLELVAVARFYNACGEYKTALNFAKRAFFYFQDTTDIEGEAEAGIELGLVMLAEERLTEAREYFSIIRHSLEKTSAHYLLIRSITFETVCDFIHGNYSRALQNALTAYALSEKQGIRRYQLYLLLITGRIFFDLGLYEEAAGKFRDGEVLAGLYGMNAPSIVFRNWTARSFLYQSRPDECIDMLENTPETRETLYFSAEAYWEKGDAEKAIRFADRALSFPAAVDKKNCGEALNWESGYTLIESMIFRKYGKNDILRRLIRALKAFIQGKTGILYNESLAELYMLTRSEKLSEYDPYNYLYYYYYAEILPQERDRSIDDRLTVLSKSVKYLQERMSRIEDTDDKGHYLSKNTWNNRIFQESRKNNLV